MATMVTRKPAAPVGAEVLDVGVDRLPNDGDLPAACMKALEEHGVLLFRGLRARLRVIPTFEAIQRLTYPEPIGVEEGRALPADLVGRATAPDRVRHTWSVGDMVIWDDQGLVHRACPVDRRRPRRMHRTTLVGNEPIR